MNLNIIKNFHYALMIDEKLAIITIHDVNPSHSEDILTVTEQLNKLKVKYNLSIVPYYNNVTHR